VPGVVLLVSCLLAAGQALPPRDAPAAQRTGTATIRGRVTAAATGEPLHRVRVAIVTATPNPPSSVTDTRGEFEITGVPAGSYSLTASRAGYLTIQYGQRAPREPGRTIQIKAGDVVEGVNIALPRGAVLAGTVFDDTGDVYPSVRVEAVEFRYVRGTRVLVQAAVATTNDIGQYRISGLAPGTYFLRASSADTWEGDDGQGAFVYANTYFPGVTGHDQAQLFTIAVGQETQNLNFAMRPGRPATVTGVMHNANGEPIPLQTISLERINRGVGGALVSSGGPGGATMRAGKDGTFEFRRVPPGEYTVHTGGSTDRVSETVVVSDGDVKSIVLAARKPSALSGTMVSDDGTPLPFAVSQVRVQPVPTDPEALFATWDAPREIAVGRDATFRFADISGSYLFRLVGLPEDWTLTGVALGGRNFVDTPLELQPGVTETKGLQIVVSKTAAKVTGDVLTRDRAPAPDSTVIIFAQERGRWTVASRFVRATRPDHTGRFTVAGLPPGIYRAAAREFVPEGQWEDPDFLQGLLASAIRFELVEGSSETITLVVEPQQ
jgi:hypothetical protein